MKHGLKLDDSGKLGVWISDLKMILTKYSNRHVGPMSYQFQEIRFDVLDSSHIFWTTLRRILEWIWRLSRGRSMESTRALSMRRG